MLKMDQITFDKDEYVEFLRLLISESKYLQNGGNHVAEETRVADHVIDKLKPYIESGKIKCQKIEYVKNRANLILEYGNFNSTNTIAFAGSHFDLVPADASQWNTNPFELIVDGDFLRGRGTTDCLGHVALQTLLLQKLAKNNIQLDYKLVVVFIADEEVGKNHEIGVLHLQKDGYLDQIKNGPVYWIDSSDIVPVMACGTAMAWTLKVTGHKFHSGFPHKGINPIPIAMEATKAIVNKFNDLCPRSEKDTEYNFNVHSNMKPTIIKMPDECSSNQYADWVEITGDVRMTPFYDPFYIKDQICQFVDNLDVHSLLKWHENFTTKCQNGDKEVEAKLDFKWVFGPYCGIACDNKSYGYNLIKEATLKHHDNCKGCSDLGAVPLVKEMQDAGIDIQIIGYGNGDAYHANNEYCTISGMEKGFNILRTLLEMANIKK